MTGGGGKSGILPTAVNPHEPLLSLGTHASMPLLEGRTGVCTLEDLVKTVPRKPTELDVFRGLGKGSGPPGISTSLNYLISLRAVRTP